MKYLKFALVLGVFTLTAIPEQAMAARSITAKELSSVCASEIRLARTERIQFHKDYAEYLKRNPEIPDAKKSRAEIIEGLSYISRKDLSDIDWYMWQTEDWIKKNHDVLSVQKQIEQTSKSYNAETKEPNTVAELCMMRAQIAMLNGQGLPGAASTPTTVTAKQTGNEPAEKLSTAAPSSTTGGGLAPQQVASCSEEIKNKQVESQSWGGNVDDVAARLGQFQKKLFEGRCAGHPEAQAYTAGANKMIGYGGNAANVTSNRNHVSNAQSDKRASNPAANSARLSQSQIATCSEDIRRKQLESQSWPGDGNIVAARLGQFQKDLFEGRCARHPEAKAYIAGADKMLGYGGNATGATGGSLPPLASGSSTSSSGPKDRSRSRLVHNPAADARSCVQLIQDSTRQGAGTSGNWRFGNNCDSTVEIFWCFVQNDGSCREGGTWTVHAGKGWPTFNNKPIKWGACRGRDGGGMDNDSNGGKYTCHLLEW